MSDERPISSDTPPEPVQTGAARGARPISRLAGLRWCLALAGLGLYELVLLCAALTAAALCLVGIGIPVLVLVLLAVRAETLRQRCLVHRYSQVRLQHPGRPPFDTVRPPSSPPVRDLRRQVALLRDLLADRRTWTDLLWVLVNPVVGLLLVLVPLALVVSGVFGLVMPLVWREVNEAWGDSWYLFVPLRGPATSWAAFVLGAAQLLLARIGLRPCLIGHGRWVRRWLDGQSPRELRRRLRAVSEVRTDLVDSQARELRRIERDLHDGAQARLVAMGMTLNAASRLVKTDPARAQQKLLEARDASATALQELRDLVRGVHPPVLADRGVVAAVTSLALESPAHVDVRSTLTGRPPLPLESALFFAVSELLANVVKHAGASRVEVGFETRAGGLVVAVRDNGLGGAVVRPGSGLDGVRRRVEAFDGELRLSSEAGWPTVVVLRVPWNG